MWWSRKPSNDARNVLFDAGLEFGTNWRRDVRALAGMRLADLDQDEQAMLVREVEAARAAIEQWILDRWKAVGGNWSRSDAEAAREFVRAVYPWLDERNISHAMNQLTYYAWHG